MLLPIEGGVWGRGSAPPQNFFKLLDLSVFWCILGAILGATLLNSTGQRATSGVYVVYRPWLPKSACVRGMGNTRARANYDGLGTVPVVTSGFRRRTPSWSEDEGVEAESHSVFERQTKATRLLNELYIFGKIYLLHTGIPYKQAIRKDYTALH